MFDLKPDLANWGLLGLRIAVGIIFIVHGWPKLTKARAGAAAFSGGEPKTAMVAMVTTHGAVEVGGGLLLILGIITQLVNIAFGIIMLGAITLKIRQWKTGFMAQQTTGWEFDFVLLAANVLLFLTGPGTLAVQSS